MTLLGISTLYLTLLLACWAFALALVGARRRVGNDADKSAQHLIASAVQIVYAVAIAASLAMLLLVYSFVIHDFSLSYVHQHSERAMPLFYRVTGVWGGMEGSMLLWVWLQSVIAALAVKINRRRLPELLPYFIAVLMFVEIFFAVLMIAHSNPFNAYLALSPTMGKGLNPLLQNPYMVTHPPSLYLGFVGLSVPFALAIAALLSRQTDDSWIHASRPWALLSWFFLSLGLTLGMLWAYEELGWGGYWGWDPVENAGFMPWLIVTAYLHSIMVQERRQMLKRWNVILAVLGFVMTIFGTFLTRSGFIDSVHAFARSSVGYVFLAFIGVVLLFSFALLYMRRALLRNQGTLESVLSREFWFLLNNWVLLSAAFLVMVLTTFPNLSELFGEKITISIPAFNRWMVPVGLVLLVITVIGPMLGWRKTTTRLMWRQFAAPIGIALGLAIALIRADISPRPIVAWVLASLVVTTVLQEIISAAITRARAARVNVLVALFRLLSRNRRRYGGYIVHIGIAVMFIGFAGEAFKQEKEVVMKSGQKAAIGRYTLRFDGLRQTADPQKSALTAHLRVFIDGKPIVDIAPARWVYRRHENNPTTEVSIRASLREDLFVAMGNADPQAQMATFKLVINPLVAWIWIGFLIMALGCLICALPSFSGGRRSAIGETKTPRAKKAAAALLFFALPLTWAGVAHADTKASTSSANKAHVRGDDNRPVLLSSDSERERKVFSSLSCMCPTCPRIPLDACNCGFAHRERSAIRKKIALGWNADKIIDWYKKQRGPEIGRKPFGAAALTMPPDNAFNRLAWLVPYSASAIVAVILVLLGLRWKRRQRATAAARATPAGSQDPYEDLLDRELSRLD
jgi:cytochrome c-type biogenesis protein CcmF